MYLLYQINDAQAEIKVPPESFLKVAETDIFRIINLFDSFEDGFFAIHPMTKKESEWVLEAYCELTRLEHPIPSWLLDYIFNCFSKINNGMSVAKALNLVNPPHRPKESFVAERDEKIYLDVLDLMGKGMTLFNSALELSEKYNLHESNIQKIYSSIKKIKLKIPTEDIEINF